MIIATVNTGNFDWMVVANDKEAADKALLEAYRKHAKTENGYADPDPDLMAELVALEEVNYHPVTLNLVLRDGAPVR